MKAQPTRLTIGKYFPFVRIIVYCLKIVGLAPFSVGTTTSVINSRQARIGTFRSSKFGLVYNLLIAILVIVVTVQVLKRELSGLVLYPSRLPVVEAVIIIRLIIRSFSGIVVMITWAFRQGNAARTMNRISEIELKISGLRKQPCKKRSLIFLTVHLIINAFVWITSCKAHPRPKYTSEQFSRWISNEILIHVTYWFTVEYFFVVGRIARGLEIVNENLLNLEGLRNTHVSCSPSVNEFLQAFSSRTLSTRLAALRSLISIRTKLSDSARDVEDFFSSPILICCAAAFLNNIIKLCSLIVVGPSSDSPAFVSDIFNAIADLLIEIYPATTLAANVTRTEKQARLTAKVVRKLLAKPVEREIQSELENFSIQLIHDDFKFTANGFFILNNTFLHSMMAAEATYIVIMLQLL